MSYWVNMATFGTRGAQVEVSISIVCVSICLGYRIQYLSELTLTLQYISNHLRDQLAHNYGTPVNHKSAKWCHFDKNIKMTLLLLWQYNIFHLYTKIMLLFAAKYFDNISFNYSYKIMASPSVLSLPGIITALPFLVYSSLSPPWWLVCLGAVSIRKTV